MKMHVGLSCRQRYLFIHIIIIIINVFFLHSRVVCDINDTYDNTTWVYVIHKYPLYVKYVPYVQIFGY